MDVRVNAARHQKPALEILCSSFGIFLPEDIIEPFQRHFHIAVCDQSFVIDLPDSADPAVGNEKRPPCGPGDRYDGRIH